MNRATLVAWVVAALSTGCATRGAVRQVTEDLRAIQSEVAALRQSQEDLSRRLTEVATAARTAQAKGVQLQASTAATTAEIERLATKVHASDEAIKEVKDAFAVRAAATPPPPEPPPAPEPPKQNRAGSAESAFASGLANFRNREYGQAVLDFLDVVTKHPKHELASTSQYWIGEAYYLQRDYRQALIEFERAAEWAAPHPKVPDALLKAGLCHSQLRESKQAEQAWRRVVREFPESPAADEARLLLVGRKSVRRQ